MAVVGSHFEPRLAIVAFAEVFSIAATQVKQDASVLISVGIGNDEMKNDEKWVDGSID